MKTTTTLSAITALTTTAVFTVTGVAVGELSSTATGIVASVLAIAVLTPKFNKIAKKENNKQGEQK